MVGNLRTQYIFLQKPNSKSRNTGVLSLAYIIRALLISCHMNGIGPPTYPYEKVTKLILLCSNTLIEKDAIFCILLLDSA